MAKDEKLDLYRQHRSEYAAAKAPRLVRVGPAQYLAATGRGAPEGQAFSAAVGALYAVAFTVKMARKFAGQDYKVCRLEGLWWGGRSAKQFLALPRTRWNWKLLIRVPEFIGPGDVASARQTLRRKGRPAQAAKVKLETLAEGLCVQILHVGSYAEEPASVARMAALAREKGLRFSGRHHEIYLSDPRRVAPERLRTILRHAVG